MSKTTNKYAPEVGERAVRKVLDNTGQHESRWSAILSLSAKIGCAPQTRNEWGKKAEVDRGERAGVATWMAEKMQALERESRELKQAMRSYARRRRILLRRSSTAGPRHDRLHRREQGYWGRADLQAPADWRVSRTAHAGFVPDALEQAVPQRQPGSGLVHHSDRGSQYLSIKYTERLAEAGIDPSVGSVGDRYDNALAETINGPFKAEVIHRRGPWRSFDAVEYATLEWVDWFNNRRLPEPIGNIPPAEAEANFYEALERSDMAA